ncbi:hypothetical protein [Candidatus Spongiihabitans sp.]|uniref:hypothetical protein n=1 Tax=Candidatus Spongiihabitans sp. TaxID=3101308 RepID=UPI003C6F5238
MLLQRHGKERLPTEILLPDDKTRVHPDDRILFAGDIKAKWKINHIITSSEALRYTLTGSHPPTSIFWRWVTRASG